MKKGDTLAGVALFALLSKTPRFSIVGAGMLAMNTALCGSRFAGDERRPL